MTTSPIPPAESPKPPVEGKLSAFQEAISKRLRTLRKRLQKIEKYEESPKAELNPDQVLAISRKEMVVFAMKELEELIKQFASIEAEVCALCTMFLNPPCLIKDL